MIYPRIFKWVNMIFKCSFQVPDRLGVPLCDSVGFGAGRERSGLALLNRRRLTGPDLGAEALYNREPLLEILLAIKSLGRSKHYPIVLGAFRRSGRFDGRKPAPNSSWSARQLVNDLKLKSKLWHVRRIILRKLTSRYKWITFKRIESFWMHGGRSKLRWIVNLSGKYLGSLRW